MSNLECSADYWRGIESIAEEVKDEIREHGGDLYEHIWESVESHEWVIYTAHNLDVLKYSNHANVGIEDGTVDAEHAIKEGGISTLHVQLACAAMIADVSDWIGGWDPRYEQCSICGETLADEDERAEHEESCGDEEEPEENAGTDADPGL